MNPGNSAIIGLTKYRNAPGEIGVSRGLATQIGPVMRPHDTANRVVRIPLHSRKYPGLHAIVDAADAELVSGYRWNPKLGRNGTFYAMTSHYGMTTVTGRKTVYMHHLVIGAVGRVMVDHIDHDGLNNRRENLRVATVQQNQYNMRPLRNASSQYKGVSWDRECRRWVAQIQIGGRNRRIGRFEVEVEAARAYDREAIRLFGEFAYLNFPEVEPK